MLLASSDEHFQRMLTWERTEVPKDSYFRAMKYTAFRTLKSASRVSFQRGHIQGIPYLWQPLVYRFPLGTMESF